MDNQGLIKRKAYKSFNFKTWVNELNNPNRPFYFDGREGPRDVTISGKDLEIFCTILKRGSLLRKSVYLKNVNIASDAVGSLFASLGGIHSARLENISKNAIVQKEPFQALAQMFKTNEKMTAFTFARNKKALNAPNLSFNEALRELQFNRALRSLDLSGNALLCDGIVALAIGLKHNKTLQLLNLSGNEIRDEGFVTFVENCLMLNTSLRELNVSSNFLGNPSMSAFSEYLLLCSSFLSAPSTAAIGLCKLHVEDNDAITWQGYETLARALEVLNSNIVELCVSLMDEHSCTAFAHMLRRNTTMTSLTIDNKNKPISQEGLKKLFLSLQHNRALEMLDLARNHHQCLHVSVKQSLVDASVYRLTKLYVPCKHSEALMKMNEVYRAFYFSFLVVRYSKFAKQLKEGATFTMAGLIIAKYLL